MIARYDSSESRAASVSSMRKTQRAAVVPGERPVEQGGAGQSDVRRAGRGRAEPRPRPARTAGVADLDADSVHRARVLTGLVRVPMPSTVTETVCPDVIGPTPAGVPVSSTSPGSSVMIRGDELDDLADGEDHVGGAAVLHHVAVQLGAHRQIGRVQLGLDPRPERAEGVVTLAPW